MFVFTIPVICYYNRNILRTETYVKYVRNKAVIVPLDVPIDCTFEQFGDMIYSRTTIDKQMFKLVLNCKYPLKSRNGCKTPGKYNFSEKKKSKTEISIENHKFSRSRMTKHTSPLESSHEIYLPRRISLDS